MKDIKMEMAIVVPIHRPKANWLMFFLESYRGSFLRNGGTKNVRLVLVCSNYEETSFFSSLVNSYFTEIKIEIIDIESFAICALRSEISVRAMRQNLNRGIINFKKILAMKWLVHERIGLSIIVDCDAIFAGSANIDKFMKNIYENYKSNLIIGADIEYNENQLNLYAAINDSSLSLFSENHQELIRKNKKLGIYSWYLSPPTYDYEDMVSFFSYMEDVHEGFEKFFLKLRWHTFDNVVFNYFRFSSLGCAIEAYNDLGFNEIPENLTAQMVGRVKDRFGIHPVWLSSAAAFNDPSYARVCLPDAQMFYHCDRADHRS